MSYRLLALDLDGTLLRSDHTVDPRDIGAIRELQAAGVTVTIATGRLHSGAMGAAEACGIEGTIACMEGSHLIEVATNTTVVHHPIAEVQAKALRDAVSKHRLAGFVFDAQGIHHDHAAAPYAPYVTTWSPNLRVVEEDLAWQTMPLAAVGIGDPDAIAAAHAAGRTHAELFSVTFEVRQIPGKHAVLARAAGPTKGTALAEPAAASSAARCRRRSPSATGSTTSRCSRSPGARSRWELADAVRQKASDSLEAQAGAGGGIAEAIAKAWG